MEVTYVLCCFLLSGKQRIKFTKSDIKKMDALHFNLVSIVTYIPWIIKKHGTLSLLLPVCKHVFFFYKFLFFHDFMILLCLFLYSMYRTKIIKLLETNVK